MSKTAKLKRGELRKIGFSDGNMIGKLVQAMQKNFRTLPKTEALKLLAELEKDPESFLGHDVFDPFARKLREVRNWSDPVKKEREGAFDIFGPELIEQGALHQMYTAMKLPVAVAGALMPDAHHGYGLPIGGVLATENSVIPYGVGVDIGCRMSLSVFPIAEELLAAKGSDFTELLLRNTRFGIGEFERPKSHAVLSNPLFREIKLLRELKSTAAKQIGSSGSGNHFVEFGIVEMVEADDQIGLAPGRYIGLLSHSGSRGFGSAVARHFTKVAMDSRDLPKEARHLAWLDLDTEAGQEYWLSMNLAGDYATACHEQIHQRVSTSLGESPLVTIQNHHNFAWKEKQADGRELIVHRKGATPAAAGQLGIIPGSMTSPGFIVRGKGHAGSLNSASHGAGRAFSRGEAKKNFSRGAFEKHLKKEKVTLLGGSLDEAPFVYKDIRQVMEAQRDLVDVLGWFEPRIVRMA